MRCGRTELGLSRGNTSRCVEARGRDDEARWAAFDACVEHRVTLWTELKLAVGSRSESIEPKCVQRPHPPIHVATYRQEGAAWFGARGLSLVQGSQQSVGSLWRRVCAFSDIGDDV